MIISLTNGNFYVLKLILGRPTLYHSSGSHDLLSTYTCAATEQGTLSMSYSCLTKILNGSYYQLTMKKLMLRTI